MDKTKSPPALSTESISSSLQQSITTANPTITNTSNSHQLVKNGTKKATYAIYNNNNAEVCA